MKKLFTLSLLLCGSLAAFSQNINFGFDGGLTIAAIHASAKGTTTTITTSGHVSSIFDGFVDFKIHNFTIEPEITLIGKGGNTTTGDGGVGQFALHYFEVPVNFFYKIKMPVGDLQIGGGPYIAFGSGGTLSIDGPGGDYSENAAYGGSGDFNSTETGFNFLAGLKLNSGLLIRLNYNLGFGNIINPNGAEGNVLGFSTLTFGISAGYVF